jgi:hypothetical protein
MPDRWAPDARNKAIDCSTLFLFDGSEHEREDLQLALKELSTKAPCSKFGIAGELAVVSVREGISRAEEFPLYCYLNGRTWTSVGHVVPSDILHLARFHESKQFPPIVSNVEVHEVPGAGY